MRGHRPLAVALAALALLGLNGCCGYLASCPINSIVKYTPVVEAATAGRIDEVRAALDGNAHMLRLRDGDGDTLLHNAVGHGQEKMAAFLLCRGAPVNETNASGMTALHVAARDGSLPLLRLLIAHRARLNAVDAKGWTPFDRAMLGKHRDAADYLRSVGGRPASERAHSAAASVARPLPLCAHGEPLPA